MEKKLGAGIHQKDDLLGCITFENLVIALQSNESNINEDVVRKVANEMLESHLEDFHALLEQNLEEIIKLAS